MSAIDAKDFSHEPDLLEAAHLRSRRTVYDNLESDCWQTGCLVRAGHTGEFLRWAHQHKPSNQTS